MSLQEILRLIRLYGKKITQLPNATLPLSGSEVFEVIQGGVNRQVSIDSVVIPAGGLDHWRGDYAGTTTMPTTGGNFTGGVPAAGDEWRLTDTLVIGGNTYSPGTIIKAMINTPGQTLTNWGFLAMQL